MAPEKHVYPSLEGEVGDDSTYDDNMTVLIEELEKFTPSNVKVKEYMKCTYINRREKILNSTVPVSEMVSDYPFVKKVSYVSKTIM